ncbi:MAG: FecR family protein [Candidatus Cryptobacteroides sp.]
MEFLQYKYLLDRFLKGESSAEENQRLREALGEFPDANFDEYGKEFWNEGASIPFETKNKIREKLFASIGQKRRRRVLRIAYTVCACAASLLIAAFAGYWIAGMTHETMYYEVTADRGQKSAVTLPDGSKVHLNSASKICYSSDYNSRNRNVRIEGEAYFEVAHNEKIPFIVDANGLNIKVLGTKFNVSAYPDNSFVEATLVEGKISAYDGRQEIVLNPSYQVKYNRENGAMQKRQVNPNHLVPWLDGEIVFSDNTLDEVARILERMYKVNIIFSDESVKQYSYTGLVHNNSLRNVLDLIAATSPVEYRIYNDTVKIRRSTK